MPNANASYEDIRQFIKSLHSYSDEELVHFYKCSLTKHSSSDKKLYKPLILAIEKERKSRNKSYKELDNETQTDSVGTDETDSK